YRCLSFVLFVFRILLRPARSPLFPYTTLFRSRRRAVPYRRARPRGHPGRPRGEGRLVDRLGVFHEESGPRRPGGRRRRECDCRKDRKSTRLNSSHVSISYAVFCLKKKIGEWIV